MKRLLAVAVVVLGISCLTKLAYADHIADSFGYPLEPVSDTIGYNKTQNPFLDYTSGHGYHLGEDWHGTGGGSTDKGDPIKAVANGHVTYAQQSGIRDWGYIVIIKHTLPSRYELCSFYGHVEDPDDPASKTHINVSTGDSVNKGQPIAWTSADFHRISDETIIPDAYLRAVECTRMRVDEDGIAWVCHPKYMDHMDADVRTSTIPRELLEGQRLFAPQP